MNNPAFVVPRHISGTPKQYRLFDILIILVCLSLAFFFVRLFYLSLYQTLDSDLEPIGHVTMRINNIQRRQGERVLWDRLFNESPVYPGDLIRVAEQSGLTFHFDDNSVELDENTMIRVFKYASGQTRIELSSGTLRLETGENGGNISIAAGGKTIEAAAGTLLRVITDDEGNTLFTAEGEAVLINEDGSSFEAPAGAVIEFKDDIVRVDMSNAVIPETAVITEEIPEIEDFIEEIIEPEPVEAAPAPPVAPPPAPPLSAPVNLQPANGFIFGPEELRVNRSIAFAWSPVESANAYIFALFHETENGRLQIFRSSPLNTAGWTLVNLSMLGRGRFIWQTEALYLDSNGSIQRRGLLAESYFIIDIPVPEVQLHGDIRNFYGN